MKKLFFLVAIALVVSSSLVNAQLQTGAIAITGGISYLPSSEKTTGSHSTGDYEIKNFDNSFSLTLKPGYVVMDNLIAGIFFGMGSDATGSKFEDVSDGDATGYFQGKNRNATSSTNIGLFAKYFLFLGAKKNFAITGEGQLGFAMGKTTNETADYVVSSSETTAGEKTTLAKSRGLNVGIQPGLAFMLNEKVMFTTEYGFIGVRTWSSIANPDDDGSEWSDSTTNAQIDADFRNFRFDDLTFGLTVFFGGE